ncbi:hypothetical protein B0J13DRAFT_447090 [Dactylonectria estremocensis]|uniref:Autophagy-related protein 28 n=1 Tax=Dactylonectria estremocensis TaxID=1079267 RepID=A0A9P9J3M8_9HYPO|nr:hypothetical protein B0J13DRAFT_447090 [Dactylonectria estremocensis]
MTSQSFFDLMSTSRNRLPILPLHNYSNRPPSEYPLDELEPRPDETMADLEHPRPRLRRPAAQDTSTRLSSPPVSPDSKNRSPGSPSRIRPKPIFSQPPPPIASSMLLSKHGSRHSLPSDYADNFAGNGLLAASRLGLESTFLNQNPHEAAYRPDSAWRSLQRREKAIERDIQQLLDLQALGLLAGSGGSSASDRDLERDSDTGGESTFYSAATSKSRMGNSLYIPPRSLPDGNVIPVRQPASRKPLGLHSARAGLHRSMAALSDLKVEEDVHLDTALAQRKDALSYLDMMSARREDIYAELHALEEDDEEPLGRELRELDAEHASLDEEIRLMEEKLVGMRNRRRWVRDRISDVKNRRESGLSGYRAAGRDIDNEVRELLRRPPVTPLDPRAIKKTASADSGADIESPGGQDFLRLRPERRTAEMARLWWKGEIEILERRKVQVSDDREALVEGARVWSEVTKLVADFETTLRKLISSEQYHRDANEATTASHEAIGGHLASMDLVVQELEQRLHLAEEKHWNLLICAIGAELEAFVEAQGLLKATFGAPEGEADLLAGSSHSLTVKDEADVRSQELVVKNDDDESDNEVPADLLVSRLEDQDHDDEPSTSGNIRIEGDGETNDVPPEFLAEHGNHVE